MAEQEICKSCKQKHDCREVFRQMGENKGPSVVNKVVVAFLLPIVVFIISLAAFEEILDGAVSSQRVQIVLGFLISILMAFICIFIVRMISRRPSQAG